MTHDDDFKFLKILQKIFMNKKEQDSYNNKKPKYYIKYIFIIIMKSTFS